MMSLRCWQGLKTAHCAHFLLQVHAPREKTESEDIALDTEHLADESELTSVRRKDVEFLSDCSCHRQGLKILKDGSFTGTTLRSSL